MDRLNKSKHLNMSLRGAIVGQYKYGSSYGKIAESLNVSVKCFILKRPYSNGSFHFRKPQFRGG